MSTFKLEDCPRLGPYWLAKTRNGEIAVITENGFGFAQILGCSGFVGKDRVTWDKSTGAACWVNFVQRAEPLYALIGPWDGKAIIGWTAEDMAQRFNEVIFVELGKANTFDGAIRAMQSLIDNKPPDPVWCEHLIWNPSYRRWYRNTELPRDAYDDPFCSKCGEPRPQSR